MGAASPRFFLLIHDNLTRNCRREIDTSETCVILCYASAATEMAHQVRSRQVLHYDFNSY